MGKTLEKKERCLDDEPNHYIYVITFCRAELSTKPSRPVSREPGDRVAERI